jgi:GTPase SAR1 family protein
MNRETHKLKIWETAVEERYHSMAPIYSQGAIGVFLVFDVRKRESLGNIRNWQNHLDTCDPAVRAAIIGNKIDIANREVSIGDGQASAESLAYDYAETSAKTGAGVEDAFFDLTTKAVDARSVTAVPATSVSIAGNSSENIAKSGCC